MMIVRRYLAAAFRDCGRVELRRLTAAGAESQVFDDAESLLAAANGPGNWYITLNRPAAAATGPFKDADIELIVRLPFDFDPPRPAGTNSTETELAQAEQAAICVYHGIRQDELAGRLFVDSGRDQPLILARTDHGKTVVTPDAERLTAAIQSRGIDVVIIDPFIQSHEVSENDNSGIAIVARAWAQVANDGDCSIDLSHHVRKGSAAEPSIEDARGAKALIDASRSARRLVRMTATEANLAGIEPSQTWRYSRDGDGKENLAPPDRARTWRKLESIELGNGDNIGVMTAWQWPDAFSDVHATDLMAVRRLAGIKRYRESSQAGDWFGTAVAEVLGLDIADKHVKAKVRQIIKTWMANGEFEVYEAENDARQTKKYVRPIEKEVATPSDF